ncbi:MAG: polysaccharide deacetylase family protein, partial [Actinobacteria bacterium]|nr:polysaccharide deacetylase family protein [Actinomycetota bacterium]
TGDTITGTPTTPGTATVTITLTDDTGRTDTTTLSVAVADGDIDCDVLKCIALTFDDGPAVYTDQVLDALADSGARATFFLSGNLVQGRHGDVERMADLGMEIGNHSFDHIFLTEEDEQEIYWQLFDTNYWIEYYTGIWPSVFRPPYGYRNTTVDAVAGELDMAVILWTDDPFDYEYSLSDADELREDVVDLASRDAVVLLHDDVAATAAAIPGIIEDLQDEGYVLVTVTELIGDPEPGEVYYDW